MIICVVCKKEIKPGRQEVNMTEMDYNGIRHQAHRQCATKYIKEYLSKQKIKS